MQLATINTKGQYTSVTRVVTERRGSWKYQDAFRKASYIPVARKSGGYMWASSSHSRKFAKCQYNRDTWAGLTNGSLHHRPAVAVVDDFGNLVFVAE